MAMSNMPMETAHRKPRSVFVRISRLKLMIPMKRKETVQIK